MSTEAGANTANVCPNRRKIWLAGEAESPRVELKDGVWHIRSLPAVRQVLRESAATKQGGFNADTVRDSARLRLPILFADGEVHRTQRAAIARFFAPKTVDNRYRQMMIDLADDLVAQVLAAGGAQLDDITMRYSVAVAAEVVGLTNSDQAAMARRLDRFFSMPLAPLGQTLAAASWPQRLATKATQLLQTARGQAHMWDFFLRDVRPAIKARRANPQEDVISYLIGQDYRDLEILIECVTYGAAGMVTTREYIGIATWHLLGNTELREQYLAAEEPERYKILWEILRLEPIVGHLRRRTTAPITLLDGDDTYEIPADAMLDLYIRAANADPEYLGETRLDLCPGRALPPKIKPEVMSFGDGPHRCPGNAIAIQESDIFLTRLLKLPLVIDHEPDIGWADLIAGYELRNLGIRVVG